MSEKNDNNWEKFLTGDQDKESPSNSPVTTIKPAKMSEPVPSTTPAEAKRSSNTPETLEEKIARVMAGINMPKKGSTPSVSKAKAKTTVAGKSEDKVSSVGSSRSSSLRTTPIDEAITSKAPVSIKPIDTSKDVPTVVQKMSISESPIQEPIQKVEVEVVEQPDAEVSKNVVTEDDSTQQTSNTHNSSDVEEVCAVEDDDETYENSVDDDESEVLMKHGNIYIPASSSTSTAPPPVTATVESKMTLSDLDEIEQIVAQVEVSPPSPVRTVTSAVKPPRSTHKSKSPALSHSQAESTPSSIRPGGTFRSSAGPKDKETSLGAHLAASRPLNKYPNSGGNSVGSGNSGSARMQSSSVSSFTPQPRRLPNVSSAAGSGYSESQMSPDGARSRQSAPWSVSKRASTDTMNSPASKSLQGEEHRVTVAVRIRPFMVGEIQHGPRRVVSVNGDKLILVNPNAFDADPDTIAAAAAAVSLENMRCNDWAKVFCFDHCLWSYDPTDSEDIYVDEEGIFEAVGSNIVNDVTRGVSSCCFAYGHTGTGKTHTMLGEAKNGSYISANDIHGLRLVESAGLAPRVFMEVVERVLADPDIANDTRITISFLEIYQEKLRDCLVSSDEAVDLKVREHPALGPYVENLQKIEVDSPQEALALLYQGYRERTTGQNNRNRLSSRSHAIATLELTSTNAPDPFMQVSTKNHQPAVIHKQEHVRLQMVDLAGSEKDNMEEKSEEFTTKKGVMAPRRGANLADGNVEKLELKMIRRSLSTLGYIIKALGNGNKSKGLPFRDSLLTWLLKDSFTAKSSTTMLATISPSHTCFDETLSTLKYAERLCNLGTSSQPGQESTSRVSIRDTIDPQLSYSLASEFSRLKKELGGSKHGSVAARHLLQQTLSDPQQRLARMDPYQSNNDSIEYRPSASSNRSFDVAPPRNNAIEDGDRSDRQGQHQNLSQSLSSSTIGMNRSNGHVNNYPGNIPKDVAVDPDLKEAYRQLHGKYVELQIELENARTDRDGMQLEMQHMHEALERANAARYTNAHHSEMSDVTAALQESQAEVAEMRGVVMRKEEASDRLLNELAEERKARDVVEQTARAQVTELIKRLEGLHKQGQEALQKSDTWQSAAEVLQSDKENLQKKISELEEELEETKKEWSTKYENLSNELKLSEKQYTSIVEERDRLHTDIATYTNEKAQMALRESALTERNQELQVNLEKAQNESKLKSELEIVQLQRDSLYEIITQQEKQIQVQQQQAENSLKMLHQRQEALDRYEQRSGGDMDELVTLQNSLHKMLANEGELLQSELIDARKMTEVITTVKEQVYEAKVMKEEINRIQIERTQLQDSIDRLSQEKKVTTDTLKSLNEQVDSLKKAAVDWETRAHYWQQIAQKNSVGGQGVDSDENSRNNIKSTADLDLRTENAKLKEMLEFSQQESATAKQELEVSKEDMQKEFSSLWLAVEQLNKLDASKDKAMAELTASYDEACRDNNMWESKYNAIVRDYDTLQRELQAIDLDLLDKADVEGIEVSTLLNHTFSPSHNSMSRSGGGSRSVSKPRTSSRSPPGARRASHGDSYRSRSHSNPRGGGHRQHSPGRHSSPHQGRGRVDSGDFSDNQSVQSGGSRRREGPSGGDRSNFVRRNQMKPDKRMSEKGLEDQIVQLSQFLEHDNARFQSQQVRSRMRVSTSSATRSHNK